MFFFSPKNYKFNLPLDSNCYTFVGKRCRLRGTIELLSVSLSVKDLPFKVLPYINFDRYLVIVPCPEPTFNMEEKNQQTQK